MEMNDERLEFSYQMQECTDNVLSALLSAASLRERDCPYPSSLA